MEEIARVYAEALFDVSSERGDLEEVHEQLGEVTDALSTNRDLQVFFFSPYFSSEEKREGISRAITGANPELVNFLELLAEPFNKPSRGAYSMPCRARLVGTRSLASNFHDF